ncbi:hypothetical protein FSW04_07835 [Baekduia soli]|uniref:Uncharacterized protein n=1 Tax=Baekduia soli TaxID=496014 RepID=A0A5B8U3Q0_9ACTN|nr:hypothetical protein [Baekduia soli]QEC47495.1 hypothetical protein FSW04_07835 [Baekduia soli]
MDEHQRDPRDPGPDEGVADELLRRALLDPEAAAAVALRVHGLAMAERLTVVFHGRRDLGTIQTYVANGGHGEGEQLGARDLLRVPCDLDLGETHTREEALEAYEQQARTMRDALQAADTVLAIWEEPLREVAGSTVSVLRAIDLDVPLPAHRLMPIALVAPDRRLTVVPVCGARTLAEGRPPMGIACAQQDIAHVYPLPDDPHACLEDFVARAAEHAHQMAERLEAQERSVQRFLEINGEDYPEAC